MCIFWIDIWIVRWMNGKKQWGVNHLLWFQVSVGNFCFKTQELSICVTSLRRGVFLLSADLLMRLFRSKSYPALLTAGRVSTELISDTQESDAVLVVCVCVSSSEENIALYDRLILMRLCERMTGKMLKSRSNVLLVRQSRLTPGNGVLLFYQSVKNKKSHHGGVLLQLHFIMHTWLNMYIYSSNVI